MAKAKKAKAKKTTAAGAAGDAAEENTSGFQIYAKPAPAGERVAVNLETGVSVETDGPGKFWISAASWRHPITSELSLEAIVGMPEPELPDAVE